MSKHKDTDVHGGGSATSSPPRPSPPEGRQEEVAQPGPIPPSGGGASEARGGLPGVITASAAALAVPAALLNAPGPSGVAMLAAIAAELPPAKVEIGTCLGRMVACPTCGKPCFVTHARGARTVTQVISSRFWVLAKCSGFCGNSLLRVKDLVTILPDSMPIPVVKPLGTVIGHFVLCPVEDAQPDGSTRVCGVKAQAQWNEQLAHNIHCPVHGTRPYPSDLKVELVDVTESHVARTLTAPIPAAVAKRRNKHTVVKHQGPFPGGIEYYFDLTYADGRKERINFNRAGAEISSPVDSAR